MMKKVGFSVKKYGKEAFKHYSKGVGYLTADGDLIIPVKSEKDNLYLKTFEDVQSFCRNIEPGVYSGFVEITEIAQITQKDGSLVEKPITNTYKIWYRVQ